MAHYSTFHHSNHPNISKPYGQRPNHRSSDNNTTSLIGFNSSSHSNQANLGSYGLSHSSSSQLISSKISTSNMEMSGYSDHHGGGGGQSYGGGGMGGGGSRGYQNGSVIADRATSNGNTLWMGNIDESMDETFIQYAFNGVGVNVNNIKIIRNKDTGLPVGYGFITFDDRNTAQNVLRELNGKKIPNIEEDKRFFLKPANRQAGQQGGAPGGGSGGGMGGGEVSRSNRLSVFVGNLSPEIDDEILHQAFSSYYPSTATAKVITADGQSKGFGFVTFEDEFDYTSALANPNMLLGQTPIQISRARHNQNKTGGGGGGPRGGGSGGGYNNGAGGDMRSRRPY